MGYRTVSTLTRAEYGLDLIYGGPVWGKLRKWRRCTVNQWSFVARRCLFRMRPRYCRRVCSVNRLRWLRVVCVDIRALWRPDFCNSSCGWFAAYPLSFFCRRWWSPSKLSIVRMKCFCNVQLRLDYRRSDAWFNLTPQVKLSHSESISWRLCNPCLALLARSRA